MRAIALSLLMIIALPTGRHATAADSAASLIEAVSRAASNAGTWEAEGRLVIQESADEGSLQTEASFRVVIERVPSRRAHRNHRRSSAAHPAVRWIRLGGLPTCRKTILN